MKKTRYRRYKRRRTRRVRKGGMDIDSRLGLPLPLSDTADYISSSITSLKNTILGHY